MALVAISKYLLCDSIIEFYEIDFRMKQVYYDFWRHRIGDKVATSACFEWFKRENPDILLVAIDDNKSFRKRLSTIPSSVIFPHLIDGVCKKRSPDLFEIFFGCLWIRLPWLAKRNIYPSIKVDPVTELQLLNRFKWMSEPYVCIHILEDAPYNIRRNINFKDMQELITRLSQAGYLLVRVGKWLGKIAKHCIDLTREQFSVMQSAVIVKHATCYVGGDTGITHIAAATGVPHVFAVYYKIRSDQAKWIKVAIRMNCGCDFSTLPSVPKEKLTIIKMHEHHFNIDGAFNSICEKMKSLEFSYNFKFGKINI
jgi:hypothetical protein